MGGKPLSFISGDRLPRHRLCEKVWATISELHGFRYGKEKCPESSMDMGDDGGDFEIGKWQGSRKDVPSFNHYSCVKNQSFFGSLLGGACQASESDLE